MTDACGEDEHRRPHGMLALDLAGEMRARALGLRVSGGFAR